MGRASPELALVLTPLAPGKKGITWWMNRESEIYRKRASQISRSNGKVISQLQTEFRVTKDEHGAVLFEHSDEAKGTPNYMVLAFLESQAAATARRA